MTHDLATPVALEVWKDPQCFAITHHVRDTAWVYFQCWDAPGLPADFIGCLQFDRVWHISARRYRPLKGYPNVAPTEDHSYYLWVKNSRLIKTLKSKRSAHDPDWEQYDPVDYQHYIVESHDFYTQIVAGSVSFSRIEKEMARPFFQLWETI